jgi:hypothetical protein
MNDRLQAAELTIFTGRFGSGKTEVAINYALLLARQGAGDTEGVAMPPDAAPGAQEPILVDLDLVTPYFRSRETAQAMARQGVRVIGPSIVGQHLDVPAITPQILGAIQQPEKPTVLDVGGDRQGARALSQFRAAIRERGYTMHFVVNPYRPFTDTAQGLSDSIDEIEASARLKVTSLVSNPNMMYETTEAQILDGHARLETFARDLSLQIAFVCLEHRWAAMLDGRFAEPVLPLKRFFVMPWEESGNAPGVYRREQT